MLFSTDQKVFHCLKNCFSSNKTILRKVVPRSLLRIRIMYVLIIYFIFNLQYNLENSPMETATVCCLNLSLVNVPLFLPWNKTEFESTEFFYVLFISKHSVCHYNIYIYLTDQIVYCFGVDAFLRVWGNLIRSFKSYFSIIHSTFIVI